MCSVPIAALPSVNASRRASSRTCMARGVNGASNCCLPNLTNGPGGGASGGSGSSPSEASPTTRSRTFSIVAYVERRRHLSLTDARRRISSWANARRFPDDRHPALRPAAVAAPFAGFRCSTSRGVSLAPKAGPRLACRCPCGVRLVLSGVALAESEAPGLGACFTPGANAEFAQDGRYVVVDGPL